MDMEDSRLTKLDEILIRIGKYSSKKELIEDALRALLRAKPALKRRDVAIELYADRPDSLGMVDTFETQLWVKWVLRP